MLRVFPSILRLLFGACLSGPLAHAQTLKVPVPVKLEAEGAAAPSVPEQRPCLVVEIEGNPQPVALPVEVDTTLMKEGDNPRDKDADIQLRDNRWHQGLFRFDLSALPKDAKIRSAKLDFTLGWSERKGSAKIEFYPMLTGWTNAATWVKPSPEAPAWKGLVAGKDYEKEAVAIYQVDEVKSNTRISQEGFGPLVADWISGRKPNNGLVAQLSGKAVQVNIRSAEIPIKKPLVHQIKLVAGTETLLKFSMDLDVVRRLVLSADDVKGAEFSVSINGKEDISGLIVEETKGRNVRVEDRRIILSDFGDELKEWLAAGEGEVDFSFSLKSPRTIAVTGPDGGRDQRPAFVVETVDHDNAELFPNKLTPRTGVYVEHRAGNLYYGGERLRLWGGVGYGSIPRMRRMGFNAWRVWPVGDKAYDEKSAVTGAFMATARGDGSEMDRMDAMYAEFKENGFFLMGTQLMGLMPARLLMRDDSFVAGGEDWEAWKVAVKAIEDSDDAGGSATLRRLAFVDERLKAARLSHASNFLNRVNPYTGKRYAEEEHIAIWELDNELGIVRHLLEGGQAKWPEYFRKKLDAKWTAWVAAHYRDQTALVKAWGKLAEGETDASLKAMTVTAVDEESARRAADFIQFTLDLADGFYQEFRANCRKQAPAGVGVAVVPFSFDTQYRPSIPWLYQQTRGDVANFGMYFWDTGSQLTRRPAAYVMDSHTVEDKVTVIYETNQARPSQTRTEYPYRLAALASQQDWDAIFFHYWGVNTNSESDEEYLVRGMKYMTTSHYWDGVHQDTDPAMTSAMAVAGRIFLNGFIPPATNPAIYRVGAKGISSPSFMNGLGMKDDTFSRGARIRFESEGEFDLIKENPGTTDEGADAPVKNGPVTWDWQRGRLIIDAPAAKVFVGPAPEKGWSFSDGIMLSGISKPWCSFALVSADGRPLAETDKAYVTAMADGANSGFRFDWNVKGGPIEQAEAILDAGRAPVRIDRVDYTLSFPKGMEWKVDSYDFALRKLADVSGKSSVVRVKSQSAEKGKDISNQFAQEIWMNMLTISTHGEAAQVVIDPSAGAALAAMKSAGTAESTNEALSGIWNPLPGLSWGDNPVLAKRKVSNMAAKHGAITQQPVGIEVADSHAVFDSPARTEIGFKGERMKDIVLTFSQPPPFRNAVADYEKRFGKPAEKSLTDDQFSQSTVRWVIPGKGGELTILMTDAQAIMKVSYSVK